MKVVPYKDQDLGKKAQVAQMFNNISGSYDLLNRVLSLGIDVRWRKKAIALLRPYAPKTILDVATGTADFAIQALSLKPEKIIGVDISEGMLSVGREKIARRGLGGTIELQLGDSEKLGFPDNTFDAATVAFGVRNFEDLEKGLSDIHRVLKPGGKVAVLEFSKPSSAPFKQVYSFYFKNVLPAVGRAVSKDKSAYTYLPASVQEFPDGQDFLDILTNVGFKASKCIPLTFGISSIYFAEK